jgi:sec-independent protein translocase protein TatB
MFDFSWSEIFVLGVVALVLIGPKDMPVAVRAITRVLKKMRRMAGEFQGHVDDMMREADLGDVQTTLRDLRSMNMRGALNRMVDSDGSLARAFDDPFAQHRVPPVTPGAIPPRVQVTPPSAAAPARGPAPAFIPPASVPTTAAPTFVAPAFVPPADSAATGTEPVSEDI